MSVTSRELAILFADVSGSTALYEKLGDRAALAAIDAVVALLKGAVTRHGGRVVKTIGDEVMAAIPHADSALLAASEMQFGVTEMRHPAEAPLHIRVGFHFGPVLEDDGDCFGDTVNTAARVAALAKAGQVMTTAATVQALSPVFRASTRVFAALSVKGKQAEVELCEVLWQGTDNVTIMPTRPQRPPQTLKPVLHVLYGGREIVLDSTSPPLVIGRDAPEGLTVANRLASRTHGRIECRGGKFYYVDTSTNGSFITLEGDPETLVRRDQLTLSGRGTLSFGRSAEDAGEELVRFACEFKPAS
jgi:adenylate cyclase